MIGHLHTVLSLLIGTTGLSILIGIKQDGITGTAFSCWCYLIMFISNTSNTRYYNINNVNPLLTT